MHDYLVDLLQCAACGGPLRWTVDRRDGDRIETADARCTACDAGCPVREGIGAFLVLELQRDDLWAESESRLARMARENPELRARLVQSALAELNPADQMMRTLVLEADGTPPAPRQRKPKQ
jgi:uncharacterized protein YbaR (Trm112 family)